MIHRPEPQLNRSGFTGGCGSARVWWTNSTLGYFHPPHGRTSTINNPPTRLRKPRDRQTGGTSPSLPAKIDLSTRGLWLSLDVIEMVPLPIHDRYDIDLPKIPVMRLEEVMGEKLSRCRRTRPWQQNPVVPLHQTRLGLQFAMSPTG